MKRVWVCAAVAVLCMVLFGCGSLMPKKETEESRETAEGERIVIGFSQLGAESDWRNANTESMMETFTAENGYELILEDGQQKQANQIMAIRGFIQQEVDYIVLAPVMEEGWDTVLQEAKDAGIPVIIVDRMVDVSDDSLFTCWVGSDFELEGKKAVEWLNRFATQKDIAPEEIHIVNIQGTIGASAQIGRTKALSEAAREHGWNLIAQESGEFTQAKGQEVMDAFLKRYDDINVVYCENDNAAFGAIDAIEKAGRKIGSNITQGEIMILSFDGVAEDAKNCVMEDKITCLTECNPFHGPRVQAIIEMLKKGETPDKFTYVDEAIFSANDTVQEVFVDGIYYEVINPLD